MKKHKVNYFMLFSIFLAGMILESATSNIGELSEPKIFTIWDSVLVIFFLFSIWMGGYFSNTKNK